MNQITQFTGAGPSFHLNLSEELTSSKESIESHDQDVSEATQVIKESERVNSYSRNNIRGTMADELTPVQFLKFAAGQIPRAYTGEALALQPFINSVKIIKTVAGDNHADLLKSFILSKLEGKALECVPTNVANADEIIDALQDSIKPDSSDVIAGRLKALRCQQNNLAEYAKQADALQRALVVEGHPLKKAREMTVKETIKLCCNNARSESVKLILEAKDKEFEQPKDVIARFIVQSAKDKEDKQVLAYRAFNQNKNSSGNRNISKKV